VYDSFQSDAVASSGHVPMPGPDEQVIGGHAVLCLGYDNASQTFLLQNSWGTSWGMQGFFTMPYAYLSNPDLAGDFWSIRLV
jgi:C1A family cysteine protease